jgi:hypothetical protein
VTCASHLTEARPASEFRQDKLELRRCRAEILDDLGAAKHVLGRMAMAELMFISETGMFHSACCCTWGNVVEWYGFKPQRHRSPAGQGFVDRSDRSAFINHSVKFDVKDVTLRAAIEKIAAKYANKTYAVTVCDCVSFTADVARAIGLKVPLVNITPYGFIQVLAFWNPHK